MIEGYEKKFTMISKDGLPRPFKTGSEDHLTVCNIHVSLAHDVAAMQMDDGVKKDLLAKLDVAYDMCKRMGNKLRDYHAEYKIPGGWRTSL